MKRSTIWNCLFVLAIVADGCIEQYKLPASVSSLDYLVVDSRLDPAGKTCRVGLSRTQSLSETGAPVNESGAVVTLVDNRGFAFSLPEISDGVYYADTLAIDMSRQYQITIQTAGGDQYQS